MLLLQIVVAVADAMLASAGAAHRQGAGDHPYYVSWSWPTRRGRRGQPNRTDGNCRRRHGQPAAPAAISSSSFLVSRIHSARREIGTQTSRPTLGPRRAKERRNRRRELATDGCDPRPCWPSRHRLDIGDGAHCFGLFADPGLGTMEFKKQGRLAFVALGWNSRYRRPFGRRRAVRCGPPARRFEWSG